MVDEITVKEINSIERLEEIKCLIKELTLSLIMCEIEIYYYKDYVVEYFNCLFQELKSLSDAETLLKNITSISQLKNDIELAIKTINNIYFNSENFNICDEQIKEIKILLNSLIDTVYTEIGNRLCEEI